MDDKEHEAPSITITKIETNSDNRTYYFVNNCNSHEGSFTISNKDEQRRPVLLTLGSPGYAMPVKSFMHVDIIKQTQADIEEFFNKASGAPKEQILRW